MEIPLTVRNVVHVNGTCRSVTPINEKNMGENTVPSLDVLQPIVYDLHDS